MREISVIFTTNWLVNRLWVKLASKIESPGSTWICIWYKFVVILVDVADKSARYPSRSRFDLNWSSVWRGCRCPAHVIFDSLRTWHRCRSSLVYLLILSTMALAARPTNSELVFWNFKLKQEHQCGSMYASAQVRFFGIDLKSEIARLNLFLGRISWLYVVFGLAFGCT